MQTVITATVIVTVAVTFKEDSPVGGGWMGEVPAWDSLVKIWW